MGGELAYCHVRPDTETEVVLVAVFRAVLGWGERVSPR